VLIARRDFLKSSGGAALAASGTLWAPQTAHAQFTIGDMHLDVLTDGSLRLLGIVVFGPIQKMRLIDR